jgi:multisubunit Na+/H+ antiporter MnhB subunit
MSKYPEIIFRTVAMPVTFILLVMGLHFFLRGHNAPGGGFIAGLIVAVAALIMRMGREQALLTVPPMALVPVGLIIAFLTGFFPIFYGLPFLTSRHGELRWPFVGELEWASAALFDLGVFLVVIGVTLTIINLLAEDDSALPLQEER